jgi:hypothetical protein
MRLINQNIVYLVERNECGAWVIYGAFGVKQYYGYTKTQALHLYRQSDMIFTNRR